jgi:hypothetical protein
MAFKIRDSGTLRTITAMTVRDGGINRSIRTVKVQHGGSLRTVAEFVSDLSASASPTTVTGTGNGSNDQTITTNQTTAAPIGGRGPFTYSWAFVSGDTASILNPAMATTAFRSTLGPNTGRSAVFRVTITDDTGQSDTADVTATFNNLSTGAE